MPRGSGVKIKNDTMDKSGIGAKIYKIGFQPITNYKYVFLESDSFHANIAVKLQYGPVPIGNTLASWQLLEAFGY